MDIAKSEQVENEIDAMIRRRHDARVVQEGERPAEEAWMESERRHESRMREENREKMRDTLERMAAFVALTDAIRRRRARIHGEGA